MSAMKVTSLSGQGDWISTNGGVVSPDRTREKTVVRPLLLALGSRAVTMTVWTEPSAMPVVSNAATPAALMRSLTSAPSRVMVKVTDPESSDASMVSVAVSPGS